jgi:hypothetical protein
MKRSLLVAVLAALMVTAIGASAAFAGEITGNGKSLKNDDGTLNGHSACAFSGLNDTSTGDLKVLTRMGFSAPSPGGRSPRK